jgi:hypothetical protein
VSFEDAMSLLDALAGTRALAYRKLFDGRAIQSTIGEEELLAMRKDRRETKHKDPRYHGTPIDRRQDPMREYYDTNCKKMNWIILCLHLAQIEHLRRALGRQRPARREGPT